MTNNDHNHNHNRDHDHNHNHDSHSDFGSRARVKRLKFGLSWDGSSFNLGVAWGCALDGGARPEEGLVVPSRRARAAGAARAGRRGGVVGLIGTSATGTPSGAAPGTSFSLVSLRTGLNSVWLSRASCRRWWSSWRKCRRLCLKAEQIVDFLAPVFSERISARIGGFSGFLAAAKTTSQDRNLQRAVQWSRTWSR